jgi:vitamin B12 transporter
MRRLFLALLIGWLGVATARPAATDAAESPVRIRTEIVVTATRTEAELRTVGNSVTVLTREEMQRCGYATVADALAGVAGVQLAASGPAGSVTTAFLRGANSEHTLLMIDGVRVNDPMSPSRGADLGNLTLDNVERIEVIRGPQSTVLGSDAIGGAIHIITRHGEGKPEVTAEAEGGSYGTWRARAGVAGTGGGWRYSGSVSHTTSDGYSAAATRDGNTEADGWRNTTATGRLEYAFSPALSASANFRFLDGRSGLDNFGGPWGDDPNFTGAERQLMAGAELRHTHGSGLWRQRLSFAYTGADREYLNPVDDAHPGDSSEAQYKGITHQFTWQHELFLFSGHALTAGYDYLREQGHSYYHSESPWGPYTSAFPGQSADMHSLYLQDQFQLGSRFFLTGGVRLDHHDRFGADVNFRLMPVLDLTATGTRFHGSVGTGFKAPSLYQLYAPPSDWGNTGNPDLRPEESWSVDGGVDQFLLNRSLWLSLTGFYNRYADLIVFGDGYENLADASAAGLEAEAQWAPRNGIRLGLAYTYTRSEDLASGEALLRRAPHVVSGTAEVRPVAKLNLAVQLLYKSARPDLDFSAWPARRIALDPYTLLNLTATYPLSDELELFGRVFNLLDQDLEEIAGYGWSDLAVYGGIRLRLR